VLWEAPERCATLIADFLTEVDKEREPGRIRESGRTEMTRAERAHEIGPADLLTDIAETWWRSMSLLARWPLNMGDFVGDFLIYTLQPAYFGRSPPLGNGKPIVIVPGDFANNLVLSNFTLWLKANGYRPTRAAIPIHVDDGMMDSALGDAIRAAARRVGRKAAIVAFKDGIRAALCVAAREPTYVSEVIGFDPPSDLSAGAGGVRVHLIVYDAVTAGQNATIHRAKEWPWPMATNPDALLILSKVLRETRIELLDSNISQGA
jgi:hypothetical protein